MSKRPGSSRSLSPIVGTHAIPRRVLADLGRALLVATGPGELRAALERSLRRVAPPATIAVRREAPGTRRTARGATPGRAMRPVPTTSGAYVLEADLGASQEIDASTIDALDMTAAVAGLVLEVERARHGAARPVSTDRRSRRRPQPIVGESEAIRKLSWLIDRVARTDFTVLIEGESGSGKELVARSIHESSRRRPGPFVPVNCAALVESLLEAELFGIEDRTATGVRGRMGKFEAADGGTLFLDEVSDLSTAAQAKLLRIIQDLAVERVGGHAQRSVDVRIVVATNQHLSDLVRDGRFRADLYYRLNGIEVQVPPLRARLEDVGSLARHFLERLSPHHPVALTPDAVDALAAYDWPGNVRELQRVLERALTMADSDQIGLAALPAPITGRYAQVLQPSIEQGETLRQWASRYARLVFERHGRNKRRACRALGISYHTLQAHLRYGSGRPTPTDAAPSRPTLTGARQVAERAARFDDQSPIARGESKT